MKIQDAQLGKPEVLYKNTTANIEALTGVVEGAIAYSIDQDKVGTYDGSAWVWTGGSENSIYYNVKDYGAVGNGIANDTSSIQDTIDAAHLDGGVVWLPTGTYLCDSLTMYRNISIIGAGWSSVLKSNSAVTLLSYPTWTAWSYIGGRLQDFVLDGDDTGTIGIDFEGAAYISINRIYVHNFVTFGMKLRSFLISQIYDTEISECGTGVDADSMTAGPGYVQTNAVTFTNCVFIKCPGWGVHWAGGSLVSFDHCIWEENGTTGSPGSGGGLYFMPAIEGLGLLIKSAWFEANKYQNLAIDEHPSVANLSSVIDGAIFVLNTNCTFGVVLVGPNRANLLFCRNVRFYDNAGTADYYTNGSSAIIYLDSCTGTTGGTGTVTTISNHASVTVSDTASVELLLSGQALGANVIPGGFSLDQIGSPAADVSMNSHKLINVTDPIGDQDVATKKYVDDHSGGSSTTHYETAQDGLGAILTDSNGIDILYVEVTN